MISRLRKYLEEFNYVAVVTGKNSARVSGSFNDVTRILNDLGIEYDLYSEVTPNPWASQADRLAEFLWSNGFDAVIAIGGGSVIDTAKVASVIAVNGGRARDYLYFKKKPRNSLPLFVVNLTHGTGSEVDRYAVLTVDDTREKRGIAILYPKVSIDDPKYTITLSKNQTIYVSLDAFYHSYESSTSIYTSPYTVLHSLEATRYIARYLGRAVANPRDIEARTGLLYASLLAGIAIDISGTHIIHALEHVLSGLNPKLPHGSGLGILGPRSIYYIHKARPSESAKILSTIDPGIKPNPDDASKAMEAVVSFQEENGFNEKLSDYGFSKDDVNTIINMLFNKLSYLYKGTPFNVTEDIVKDIIEYAL